MTEDFPQSLSILLIKKKNSYFISWLIFTILTSTCGFLLYFMELCLHQFQELQLYSGIITGRKKKWWYDDCSSTSQAHQGGKQHVSIKDKPNSSFLTTSFCSFTVYLIARQNLFNFRYMFWFFLQDVISSVEENSIISNLVSLGAWIPGPISDAFRVVVYNVECFSWQPSHSLHAMVEILES